MDLFDEFGDFLGEGIELFDGDGNIVGYFLESAKDGIDSAFGVSWVWGLVFLFLVAPGWALLGVVLWALFVLIKLSLKLAIFLITILVKLVIILLGFVLRCLWWLIQLPFCLIFDHEFPDFM